MKRIVLVGNGCGVLEKEKGNEIDAFDGVIRLGTYKIEGFEKYVGEKTDFCITAHWKLDLDRLKTTKTFITFPVFSSYYDEPTIDRIRGEIMSSITDEQRLNIMYFMTRADALSIVESYKELGNVGIDLSGINPSLGYRALRIVLNHFSGCEIYTYGFDFFKTGWYWKESHNRNIKNRHPYSYERVIHSLLVKSGRIKEL
jgi:hypothetical protein